MDYPHSSTSRGANVRDDDDDDDDDDDGERVDDITAVPSVVERRERRGATSFERAKCFFELKHVVWSWSRHHGARVAVRRTRTREQGPG